MSETGRIDLNADLGEMDDPAAMARDRAMMEHVSSCNIASGGHAGTETTMRAMLVAARAAGVAAGAHPSYPDRENFGRRSLAIAPDDLKNALVDQIERLAALAADEGVPITHAKPHGALYNDAADDRQLALLIAETMAEAMPGAYLVGLAGSEMARAAKTLGIPFVGEGFADRRYTPAARLLSRGEPGAVIAEEGARIEQALALVAGSPLADSEGGALLLTAETICLHSDSDGALESARALRAAMEAAGFTVAAPK